MKTFKTFLSESSFKAAIASFDATKLDLKDLIAAHKNAGYEMDSYEENSYRLCVYGGFKNSSHVYYAMWEDVENSDDEESPTYAISVFRLTLNKEGKITAEVDSMPMSDGLSEDEAERQIAKLKHK